ncbi:hypothetical protein ACFY71_36180 [Streptomyces cinerochromogenes]|uniref:hypothetical protein n=1 Tax=Streptomyces cinerochromogenes TaxID=66422 RepID=UPI0036879661
MPHPPSEQFNADVTVSDLYRCARRDAENYLTKHPLPDTPAPLPDLTPYLHALTAAGTPAEASAITHQLVGATAPVLDHIASHFIALALWAGHEHRHTAQAVRLLREAAFKIRSALHNVAQADLDNLRAHYAPQAMSPAQVTAMPSPAPASPGHPSGPQR